MQALAEPLIMTEEGGQSDRPPFIRTPIRTAALLLHLTSFEKEVGG